MIFSHTFNPSVVLFPTRTEENSLNSPLVLHEVVQKSPTEFDPDIFRASIARRCANILLGCHQHKLDVDYTISAVLAGIALVEMVSLKTFQAHIHEQLAKLAGRELEHVEVTVTSFQRKVDTDDKHGTSSCNQYLRITATIK
jgi:hypothetical protein